MKKILLILAITLISINPSFARNGLSVGLGLGVNPDPGGVRNIVEDDGIRGVDTGGAAAMVGYGLPSKSRLNTLAGYSSPFSTVRDINEKGRFESPEISLHARFDFFHILFIRGGVNYTKLTDIELSWQYTGYYLNGGNQPTLAGQTSKQVYKYQFLSVPVTLGLNLTLEKGKYNIYFGLGPTFIKGNFSIDINFPQDAVFALVYNPLTSNQFSDKLDFSFSGIGMNFLVGADAKLTNDLLLYVEVQYDMITKVKGNTKDINSNTAQLFNTTKVTAPLNLENTVYRFGVRYYIF